MDSLIDTAGGCHVVVVPEVDVCDLIFAHEPSNSIRASDVRALPSDSITLPGESSEGIGSGCRKRELKVGDGGVSRLLDDSVEIESGRELDELTIDDVKLPRSCVISEDGVAHSTRRVGLEIHVVVGFLD